MEAAQNGINLVIFKPILDYFNYIYNSGIEVLGISSFGDGIVEVARVPMRFISR